MAKPIDIRRRKFKAGEIIPVTPIPPQFLIGVTTATLTLVVDDPNAIPPTDAKLLLTIEASRDGGLNWFVVSSTWAGISGTMVAVVPVRDRMIRLSGRAEMACTVDVAVEVV